MIASASPRTVISLLLVASVAVVGGALLFQYVGGLEPCELCLYRGNRRRAVEWRRARDGSGDCAVRLAFCREYRARLIPCRRRASSVRRPDRLYRQLNRCLVRRSVEGPAAGPPAGELRRARVAALWYFAGGVESRRLGTDYGVLPGRRRQASPSMSPASEGRQVHRLPGDPLHADAVARMIRVDHAGEY